MYRLSNKKGLEMTLGDLVEDVDERRECGLIIDFDSIIFLSAYKYKDEENEELVYMDCCKRIAIIERECYSKFILTDTVLALTSSTNFRYKLYDEYKANRKQKDESAEKLSQLVKRAKRLIYDRLRPILVCDSIGEADDSCIDYAMNKGYMIAAIDSDVVNQSPTSVFNFHNKHWKFVHDGRSEKEIFSHIVKDSIAGKTKDNVKGIKGKGKVFAEKFIASPNISFQSYIELFDLPEDMLLNFRLCDCRQYQNGKLELATVKSISDEFTKHLCPF